MITVMKFGGTSMGTPEALQRAVRIIMGEKNAPVVVASAMSGITNFLIGGAENLPAGGRDLSDEFEKKHIDAASKILNEDQMNSFRKDFDQRMEKLRELLEDENALNDPYFKDDLSSQGERFSTLILSHALKAAGARSVALTSEDCGIVAEGRPLSGSADLPRTESSMAMKVKPYVDEGIIPVITGFYGINLSNGGKPLTFGRGGSDYAAAVVANAISADRLEIWTDVDGFMSADPRIIPDAVKIEEMNFSEAAELAYFGAKVLHPRTIEPVRMKQIPLTVRNSFKPDEPGTIIHHLRKQNTDMLMSVALKTDLSIISISSAEIAYRPGMIARIVEKIAENEVAIYSVSTSLSTVAFLVHNNDIKTILSKLNTLNPEDIERIEVKSDMALVCAVGDNLLSKCGVSADIFAVVKEAKANVEMISEGASDVSLNFVVPMSMATEVVKLLHKKYVRGSDNERL